MRLRVGIAVALVALCLGVFLQVRDDEFVDWDDTVVILDNEGLRDGFSLDNVIRHLSEPLHASWIPLTSLSLQLDYVLYGVRPAGYLVTNVLIHTLSSVLLFLVVARITRSTWRSAFVAAVFAVHPLHVESVAWASERKDVLSGLFFILTLHAYARFVECRSLSRGAGVALCYAAGLLAKPMLVTLPFVLLLLDRWPFGRLQKHSADTGIDPTLLRRALVEKLPLLLIAGIVSVITFVVQQEKGAMKLAEVLPLGDRVANALVSYVAYLFASFWPTNLAVFYPHPVGGTSGGTSLLAVAGAAALLLAITVGVVLQRSRPYLSVGWLWFVGMLVPVIGLVQVGEQARADRYMYLPQIGLSLMVAWGVVDLSRRWKLSRTVLAAVAALCVVTLASVAYAQVAHWRNSVTLFSRAAAATRDNPTAHYRLARALRAEHRFEEAEVQLAEALRLAPESTKARYTLASLLAEQGKIWDALSLYREVVEADPAFSRGQMEFARLLVRAELYEEARERLMELRRTHPDSAEINGMLTLIEARLWRE